MPSRRRSVFAAATVVVLVAIALAAPADAGVRWRHGDPGASLAMSPAALEDTAARLAARPDARHVVVRFAGPLAAGKRDALAAHGLRLLAPLGDHAWFAAFDGAVSPARIADAVADGLERIDPIHAIDKLHPDLARGVSYPWARVPAPDPEAEKGKPDGPAEVPDVAVTVMFHRDVDATLAARSVAARHGGRVVSRVVSINAAVVHLRADRVAALAAEDGVMWVEPPLPRLTPINDSNRDRVGAEIVNAAPYGLDGSGVQVLVYDGGKVFAHGDLAGRLTIGASDTSGISDHSTHVAGTIAGDGAGSAGQYRGMAPGAEIVSYGFEQEGGLSQGFLYTDPGDIEADYGEAIATYGADLSNNSIGTNTAPNGYPCDWEGNYGATGALIDAIARGSLGAPFRIVWANGNERGSGRCGSTYVTTAPPACAKNHITVGAMNSNDDSVTSFTSWGPCDDGRMKPDVSAPGCESGGDGGVTSLSSSGGYTVKCGTSMAAPTAAGVGALVLQGYRQTFPGRPDFRNATLKAILANSAVDLEEPGPDYKTGFGSIRAQAAVDTVLEERFVEAEVAQGDVYAFLVLVDVGTPELKVTLAWDDAPGTPNVDPVLVNDLDLRVIAPDGSTVLPWTLDPANPADPAVATARDGVNNAEQVSIENPAPGAYRVEVVGFDIADGPTQTFGAAAAPSLINCAPAGNLGADRARTTCESSVGLRVIDCDLNTDDGLTETALVSVASGTDGAGESVLLTESAPESAAFLGSVPVSATDGPGIVQVAHGDVLTITYVDADDGEGGTNVPVVDTVAIDCVPPVVVSVATLEVNPRDAVVGVEMDEPGRVTVSYGTSCGALDATAVSFGLASQHAVTLGPLVDDTNYFYLVDVQDEAGNQVAVDAGGTCFSFTTPEVPDFFSEQFTAGLDLVGQSITFTPGVPNDFYGACLEPLAGALPTDPAGGTTLAVTDDGAQSFMLTGGAAVSLYGAAWDTVHVSPNGYVTFGQSDGDYSETFADHFSLPRVSALFDDLNPTAGGTVSYRQLADRVAVTWDGVAEYSTTNENTFQIELFFDGAIRMSWLAIAVQDAIVGLSEGVGQDPAFLPTDLSAAAGCGPRPPYAVDMSVSTPLDTPVVIDLAVSDDGLPDPPAALDVIVDRLPTFGTLTDVAAATAILAVPHVLPAGSTAVRFDPPAGAAGWDSFGFHADDGGVAPEGGRSRDATVGVSVLADPEVLAEFLTDDADPGWSTTGAWAFGPPTGGGSHNGDPAGGATGANVYGYDLAGDYPNSMSTEYLTSGPIDLSAAQGATVEFERWLGIESSSYDHASFDVSADGSSWTTIWEHSGGALDPTAWTQVSYDVGDVLDGAPAARLRWRMGTTDGSVTYAGWNIDDVRVVASAQAPCFGPPAPVAGVVFGLDRATLTWGASSYFGGSAPTYDVVRSNAPDDFTVAVCVATDTTTTSVNDPQVPPAGEVRYYLVLSRNECGDGGPGSGTGGLERVVPDCP